MKNDRTPAAGEAMPSRRRFFTTALAGTAAAAVGVTAAHAAAPSQMAHLIDEHRRAAAADLAAVIAHDRADIALLEGEEGADGADRREVEQLEREADLASERHEAARRRLFAHHPADLAEAGERARYVIDEIEIDTIDAADIRAILWSLVA